MNAVEIVICAVIAAAFAAAVFFAVRRRLFFSCGTCGGDCAHCSSRCEAGSGKNAGTAQKCLKPKKPKIRKK